MAVLFTDFIDSKYSVTQHHYASVTSTNTVLKEMAKAGAPQGTLVEADCQTGGRGRFERIFHSEPGTGIYMSLLLRPETAGFDATLITTAAAVAVALSIEEMTEKKTGIKWVNDVFLDGKKVCGILAEASLDPRTGLPAYIILGIGVNTAEPVRGFHPDIAGIAGAVFDRADENRRCELAGRILNRFMGYYEHLTEKTFYHDYTNRCFILGAKINVIKPDAVLPAMAVKIDAEMRLVVQYPSGETEALSSGEISIKPFL